MDESGTTDAPQALALHVLQSLVLHSPLSPFLRPHLTSLTSTCLHAFASLSWAIRNAALQLFGSLVSSLVGQKKVRDDTSALNSLTTPEFVSRHPSLVQLLLSALSGDSECHTEGAAECRSTLTLMKLSHWPRNTIESLFLSEAPIRMDLLEICSDAILYEIKDCHCASWLLKCESCFWHHLEESILTPKAMAAILQFLTVIMEKVESAGSSIPTQGLAVLLSCMKGLQGSSATYAALVLLAHLMRHPANITEDILAAFAGVLSQHSHPTSSEDHRLAASVALKVAIKPIFTCHHQVSLTVRKQLVMSTVALLQDEDSLIRDTATGIVVALVTPSGAIQEHTPHSQPNPHPNLALFEFFRQLAFEAGVYVVSCKVFKLLCEVFGVSPELAYLLVWSEKGYGTVDEMG
ncbi:Thyroid adenoma-associated [Portunus trituberculatus]|uniref:Thyroid adenoma-associated n=1 Tax=Portunus trituberculatus TaxID=210409 RepID=A0A5B7CKY6_PORTR|nr:Thyroid adenoma-associated [Portunus trituberculatus]